MSSCPDGYESNDAATACQITVVDNTTDTNTTDTNTTDTNTTDTNTTTTVTNSTSYRIIPFPFIIMAVVLFCVSLAGKINDNRSLVVTNYIAFHGVLQFFYY